MRRRKGFMWIALVADGGADRRGGGPSTGVLAQLPAQTAEPKGAPASSAAALVRKQL